MPFKKFRKFSHSPQKPTQINVFHVNSQNMHTKKLSESVIFSKNSNYNVLNILLEFSINVFPNNFYENHKNAVCVYSRKKIIQKMSKISVPPKKTSEIIQNIHVKVFSLIQQNVSENIFQ